ncbi:uncharacterized protein NMK_2608 [Novimethylophilus kurashikiensis]|uniref:Uncharacterized protein n=1 Tax=Novimethylophilus kurashikiensis TaxID=1825523 RepID=A0A2R5F9Y5_9PROT|nr:hypothetical protein [Novimethylophilus kurashikiensis]GBG15007.1 uncharacterized protein NMK_2608 [Novimethylophilus kurashikiensis]
MNRNRWAAGLWRMASLFAIYGAAHAGVLSDLEGREEETWLGIG